MDIQTAFARAIATTEADASGKDLYLTTSVILEGSDRGHVRFEIGTYEKFVGSAWPATTKTKEPAYLIIGSDYVMAGRGSVWSAR